MQLPTAYEGYLENWSRVWRQTRFLGPGSALHPAPRSRHTTIMSVTFPDLVAYSQHLLFSSEHPRAKRSDTVDTVDTKESVVKERMRDL